MSKYSAHDADLHEIFSRFTDDPERQLDQADLAALALLDDPTPEPAPSRKLIDKAASDALEAVDCNAGLQHLAKQLRDAIARDKQRRAHWNRVFDQAKARIDADKRAAKATARRARDILRKREQRAGQITSRRIDALDRACANHRGKYSLVKLAGRARELASFRDAVAAARTQHGPKASLTEMAEAYTALTGIPMGKDQARKRLKIVTDLEGPGGPWHRWRTT